MGDTELQVIKTLGELGSQVGSFNSLAGQCHCCKQLFVALHFRQNLEVASHYTAEELQVSAITCDFCFIILQGLAGHGCLDMLAEFKATIDVKVGHVLVSTVGKKIRFQSAQGQLPILFPFTGRSYFSVS